MAKRELPFPKIEKYIGGSQEWYPVGHMRLGGCSTCTAAEISMYLAEYKGKKGLCKCKIDSIRDFVEYSKKIYKYIYPRFMGLHKLSLYIKGYEKYATECGESVNISSLDGNEKVENAMFFIKDAIDDGYPLAYLLLKHQDEDIDEIEWHWFTVIGYEDTIDDMIITFVTWGEKFNISLKKLWATNKTPKGGIVCIK